MLPKLPRMVRGGVVLVLVAHGAAAAPVTQAVSAHDSPRTVRVAGEVLLPGGVPARGAVVVTSAGAQAAVGADGAFALDVSLAPDAHALDLTAAWSGARGTHSAHRRLTDLRGRDAADAGTLLLASTGAAPEWIPTFGETPGTEQAVQSLEVFDDGTGPALYAGGNFKTAGGASASCIARWDGERWSALGAGLNNRVDAMCVFDDGYGPALYVGGYFKTAGGQPANNVARWDGQAWSALGAGVNLPVVALAVWDDGTGPALYAGGSFTSAGGEPARHLARWDGQAWSEVGGGTGGAVLALGTFDDGGGEDLYVGGNFHKVGGGIAAEHVARWDGQAWSTLGTGTTGSVYSFAGHDDGSGTALYVGGWFSQAGGVTANNVARWNGSAWSALDGGTSNDSGAAAFVYSLVRYDDGTGGGTQLYAGGEFDNAGGQEVHNVARWDGQGWSALDGGVTAAEISVDGVRHLAVFDDGSGPALCAGGEFEQAGGLEADHVARWDASGWDRLGDGLADTVYALAVYDDGTGPALYVGGEFESAGGLLVNHVARWDGQSWSPLGEGVTEGFFVTGVAALEVYDDGSGPALYAAGWFGKAGGVAASHIARWDGQTWSALGEGTNDRVYTLKVYDDGTGPALYVGGAFSQAGGQLANHVARWDGQSWSPLGTGTQGWVLDLAVYDDGSGPGLYAGGFFVKAGGVTANNVARWDGTAWSALGLGTNAYVFELAPYDDGGGEDLYVAGSFTLAGGMLAGRIARWDGAAWSTFGPGLGSGLNGHVKALLVYDDGSGPGLYVGGEFSSAGGVAAENLARWDASGWTGLASGTDGLIDDGIEALAADGEELFAGGYFRTSLGNDSYVARRCVPVVQEIPGCFGNPAMLTALSHEPVLGQPFSVELASAQIATGLGLLFLGAEQTDAAGCGVLVPGIGELLLSLAPLPLKIGAGLLSSAKIEFHLPVPSTPALAGLQVALHGVVAGVFDPAAPIELSNALTLTLVQ